MIPSEQSQKNKWAVANILAFACTITANYLANALPVNGKTTGELSDEYPNYFTPAGLTFSIWGVIYFFLFGFVVYQAVMMFKNKPESSAFLTISPYFTANCLLNASWIFTWHYQLVPLSFLIIVGMLITLIAMHNKLQLPYSWKNARNKWLVDVPISLYLGWITIATIANATVLLITFGWRGAPLAESTWAILMMAAGTLICLLMIWRKRNLVYAAVVVWALYGIIVKRMETATGTDEQIALYAKIFIGVILAVSVARLVRRPEVENVKLKM